MQKLVQKKQPPIDDEGDSVREIRALRWKMNSEPANIDEINKSLELFGFSCKAARTRGRK